LLAFSIVRTLLCFYDVYLLLHVVASFASLLNVRNSVNG